MPTQKSDILLIQAARNLGYVWPIRYAGEDIVTLDAGQRPTDDELNAEMDRLEAAGFYADYAARMQQRADYEAYRAARAQEYPSIGDQLDALFHAGVFPPEMAAKIQAVKDKHSKVEFPAP
jgi:hypothetical protein